MVDELGMGEVKRLLDVVSLLVYSDSSHAALQDELVILVRKQLSHSDLKYVATFFFIYLDVAFFCIICTFSSILNWMFHSEFHTYYQNIQLCVKDLAAILEIIN